MTAGAGHTVECVTDGPLPYLLSRPSARTEAATRPVICFLHGYGEAAPVDIRIGLTRHGPLRPSSATRARRDFIVVAPQLPRAGDTWMRYADTVVALVGRIQRAESGDLRRTYLTGFSYGGNGALEIAAARPEPWAAVWAVDPTRVPVPPPSHPVWLSIGQVARALSDRFIRQLRLEPAGVRTTGDRLYLDQGLDHVRSAAAAYGDERIYDWLLSKRAA